MPNSLATCAFEVTNSMLVVLGLVTLPADLVAEVPDGTFEHLCIIHRQAGTLSNLWQGPHLPLNIAHSFYHGAKVLAHFFQKRALVVGGIGLVSHTTSLALMRRNRKRHSCTRLPSDAGPA